MEKEFDRWNERKKRLHVMERSKALFYYEREVWWCSIGMNVGVEAYGKHQHFERPVLVVKKFNKEMFWGVPLTSKPGIGQFSCEVTYGRGPSWAMLSQLKNFSSKRLLRKIGMVQSVCFSEILKRLSLFITIEPPSVGKEVLGGRSP